MQQCKVLFVLIFCLLSLSAKAQELNAQVIVNSERMRTTEKLIFDDMEKSFMEFLNNRKWTDDEFLPEERIACNIVITLDDNSSIGSYTATVQVQSARPVYNSSYETILFNFADRAWEFEYVESQPLYFNDNTFTSNLTSMLAYYAYIVLAYDYDSFGRKGGTQYLQKAWSIVINAQQAGRSGWQQFENNRNRYWLAENLQNPLMISIRDAIYEYHRLGLDLFAEDPVEGRKQILEALKKIQAANRRRPNSILTISFFDAKAKELAKIFSEGDMSLRQQAYDILLDADPSNGDKYADIIKN